MTNTEKAKALFARLGDHPMEFLEPKEKVGREDDEDRSDEYRENEDRRHEQQLNDHLERGLEDIANR